MLRITSIHCNEEGFLCLDPDEPLATVEDYGRGDRSLYHRNWELRPREYIQLKEGFFSLDKRLKLIECSHKVYEIVIKAALTYGKKLRAGAPVQHHAAFGNSVVYLVTGSPMGYGGRSCREHSVRWALEGATGEKVRGESGDGNLVFLQRSQPTHAGGWVYEKALAFAEPFCYDELTPLHYACLRHEACFDDSPEDLKKMWQVVHQGERRNLSFAYLDRLCEKCKSYILGKNNTSGICSACQRRSQPNSNYRIKKPRKQVGN